MSAWPERWEALRRACDVHAATGHWLASSDELPRFEIGPPASMKEVSDMEARLGCQIPRSLRRVFLDYSARVRIDWRLPESSVRPEVFRHVWAGECRWDMESLPELFDIYRDCLGVFSYPDDYWDGPWQNKFPVLEVMNGDMLGIDIGEEQPVVYLSHEGDDSVHGYWLGKDFEDYVDRLSLLGCVGSEDWQLKPFVSGPRSLLETEGANARNWREWFGLQLPIDKG